MSTILAAAAAYRAAHDAHHDWLAANPQRLPWTAAQHTEHRRLRTAETDRLVDLVEAALSPEGTVPPSSGDEARPSLTARGGPHPRPADPVAPGSAA